MRLKRIVGGLLRFKPPIIVVHGGAGSFKIGWEERKRDYLKGLREALIEGFKELTSGSAVDAVEVAVRVLEDNPAFNAGLGSSLNLKGEVEMDAGIMDGSTLRAGAVGAVKRVKNPISLARMVMEYTDHVLLVGEGAELIGSTLGLKLSEIEVSKAQVEKYKRILKLWREGEGFYHLKKLKTLAPKILEFTSIDTVGSVALDSNGNVAAATSTGGIWLKLPGRIGDTPIPGAGFYADNSGGAASATGIGEYIIMSSPCRKAVELMCQRVSATTAAKAVIEQITELFGKGIAGIITVDVRGYVGMEFNTEGMGRGVMASELKEPIVRVFREE